MELNYNFKIKNTSVKSALKKADSTERADLFVDKKHNWLEYKIEFNTESEFKFKSELYETIKLNNKTVFKTNTLAVLLTNVYVNNIPYYYKINFKSEKQITLNSLIVDFNLKDVVEYNNNYYTNSAFYLHNSEFEFLFTERVLQVEDYKVIFRADYLEIEAPFNTEIKIDPFTIKPSMINEYSFYLPSFYLKTKSNNVNVQCIESDIKIFESKLNVENTNFLKYKLEKNSNNILKDFNLSFSILESKDVWYRISTHCLLAKNTFNYFKINLDGSIVESNKSDYSFKIIKSINTENINLTPNIYKKLNENFKDIRGVYINSYKEEDSSINAFGLIYNKINTLIPTYNYINNFYYTNFNFNINSKVKLKSIKTDVNTIKVLPQLEDNSKNYVQYDSINYLLQE